ncbi:MAG TPA: asparaginase, partial [Actinomycetes bacterium]|nr:asparaginase [Actinomycetes bacterium]
QVPSWNLEPDMLLELARRADELLHGRVAGVVVTQGTDTLEETAYLLDRIVQSQYPVVVTGAMRNNSELGADGPRNLYNAVRVAADPATTGRGTLVVFNEEIHAAREVTKTHSFNVSTFRSPYAGPVGYTDTGGVVFTRRPEPAAKLAATFLPRDIYLLKMTLGTGDLLVRCCVQAAVDGIVLEGTGLGHVPGKVVPAIRSAVDAGIPVLLTSRTFAGRVLSLYGSPGGGQELREAGVILAGDLSGQKARLELMAALGAGLRGEELRAHFERYQRRPGCASTA